MNLAQLTDASQPLAQAYLIIGEPQSTTAVLNQALSERQQFDITQMADYQLWQVPKLTVALSRTIKAWLALKPTAEEATKVAVIAALDLTLEAQNALLKATEEPKKSVVIFLITQNLGQIIPTLRSRCQIIAVNQVEFQSTNTTQAVEEFLTASVADRLIGLKANQWPKLLEASDWFQVLTEIELVIFKQAKNHWQTDQDRTWSAALELILTLKQDHSRSINLPTRLQLEVLAINLPVVNLA